VKSIFDIIKSGGVVVIPTDTLYGVHALALDQKAVEKVYKLKKRTSNKPFIVLISSLKDLGHFEVKLSKFDREFLEKNWPGKLSVILPVKGQRFEHLHRGTKSLAFRVPDKKSLTSLIKKVGPLVSSTANTQGHPPAKTIEEAKRYFGNNIDCYEDKGTLNSKPSTLVKLEENNITVLRQGAKQIK